MQPSSPSASPPSTSTRCASGRAGRTWDRCGLFFLDRLRAYTGSAHPEALTFDDLELPLTVAAARGDGYSDFLGPSQPARRMLFGGREWSPINTPIVDALIAGWSMNTYVQPAELNGQQYRDGGGTFYDPALFVACMDDRLVNLLNIHLDEPEGHSYNLPPRPNLLRLLFDTHNYAFPEERRRMRLLTDLLFEHERLRRSHLAASGEAPADFRQAWELSPESIGLPLPEAVDGPGLRSQMDRSGAASSAGSPARTKEKP